MNNETNETNGTNNQIETIILNVFKLVGKECCLGCYRSMKSRMPDIYAYQCNLLGRDILEFVNSL